MIWSRSAVRRRTQHVCCGGSLLETGGNLATEERKARRSRCAIQPVVRQEAGLEEAALLIVRGAGETYRRHWGHYCALEPVHEIARWLILCIRLELDLRSQIPRLERGYI